MRKPATYFLLVAFVLSFFGTNLITGNQSAEAIVGRLPIDTGTRLILLPPKAPSNLTSTGKTSTSVTLSWTRNSTDETGFKIERKTGSGSYSEVGTTTAGVTSYTNTGLAAGTTYSYRVRAYNSNGNSAYSGEVMATTNLLIVSPRITPSEPLVPVTPIMQAPAAPSNLAVTGVTSASISLSWKDNSANETGFKIERKTGSGSYSQVATVAAGVVSYTSSGLSADTIYYFRVRAYNSSGDSAYTSEVNGKTSVSLRTPIDTLTPVTPLMPVILTAPAAPSNLAVSSTTASSVTLTWKDNSNNETGFKIERKTGSGSYSQVGTTTAGVVSYTNSGLTAATTYTYRVRAYNSTGNSSFSAEVSATTPSLKLAPVTTLTPVVSLTPVVKLDPIRMGPAAPSNLAVASKTSSSITLSWKDNSTNETGFKIERKTFGGSYSQVGTVGAGVTTYTNPGLAANTTYYFRVRAYNTGNSAYSNEIFDTTNAITRKPALVFDRIIGTIIIPAETPSASAPDAPTELTATAASTEISLEWKDVSNETGYKIERKTEGGTFEEVGELAAGVTACTDSGLIPATKYYYRVKAFNGTGSSGYSNEASATTGAAPADTGKPAAPTELVATALSKTEVSLSWKDNADDETGFILECKLEGGDYVEFAPLDPDTNGISHPGLTEGVKYYYRVKAFNANGDSAYSNEADVTPGTALPVPAALEAPTELVATAKSGTQIELSWKSNSPDATGIKIESKTEGGEFTPIGTWTESTPSCTDENLQPNTKYYYRIAASNTTGDSEYSNEASATTLEAAAVGPAEVKLYIGSASYSVNNTTQQMDVAPIVRGGRTLLPARYIAEALGATVEWVAGENKVVITRDTTVIEMWLNQSTARVNGIDQYIDSANPEVQPISIPPGRTMTPGRFIAENLGATVGWDPATQEVTISYTPPAPTP